VTTDVDARTELVKLMETADRLRRDGDVAAASRALDAALALPLEQGVGASLLAQLDIVAGEIRLEQGRHADALTLFERAMSRAVGSDSPTLAVDALVGQGVALRILGRYDEAYRTLTRGLEFAGERLGADAIATAGAHNEMGVLLKAMGEYAAALRHYHAALPVLLARYGESCEPVATLYHNLGGIGFVRGDLDEARDWAQRGVQIRQKICGDDHINVILDQAALVPILIQRGEYEQARTLLDTVLPRLERDYGPWHYEVSVALTNLGALEAHEQRWEQARDRLLRAAEIKRNALGPDSPELVRTLANLAFVAENAGDSALARESTAEAQRVARTSLPPTHPVHRTIGSLP
jgi:tetratricopeptide (TPR) repeat protein